VFDRLTKNVNLELKAYRKAPELAVFIGIREMGFRVELERSESEPYCSQVPARWVFGASLSAARASLTVNRHPRDGFLGELERSESEPYCSQVGRDRRE